MNIKISNFRGHKYRRYSVLLKAAAILWLPYAIQTYFIFPSWMAFSFSVIMVAGVTLPLWLLASACDVIAEREFDILEMQRS
jgi:asparagine N-glycosylation enzyme membrane subunit Stt3